LAGDIRTGAIPTDLPEFDEAEKHVKERIEKLLNSKGTKTVDYFHKKLGKIIWNECGMSRNEKDLLRAIDEVAALREEFWNEVNVPGTADEFNQELEKAGRVADFLELGELMCKDALERSESCGGHFREESQTEEGEALRNDKDFTYVSSWEYNEKPSESILHKEELVFENIEVKQRSYK